MKYFFDFTGIVDHLKSTDHFTGIQRVVVMITACAAAQQGGDRVFLAYAEQRTGSIRTVAVADLPAGVLLDAVRLAPFLGLDKPGEGVPKVLAHYRRKPLKFFFHRTMLDLAAVVGWTSRLRRYRVTAASWLAMRRVRRDRTTTVKPAPFRSVARPGDHLILLDSAWSVPCAAGCFRDAAAQGIRISMMVHDLIPIMAPELVPPDAPRRLYGWLLESLGFVGQYLTNSACSRADLDRFLDAHAPGHRAIAVPLAQAGLPSGQRADGREAIPGLDEAAFPRLAAMQHVGVGVRSLAAHPFVLFVGTLETRKNVWRMALAWDRLRRMEGLAVPRLVLAGRTGWLNDDFDALAGATGNLHGWIEIVRGPSDADLDFLYRHCAFTINVSLYEGWGLPVGESLAYGKTAVVAKASSLPEVGGDLVEYCDPQSVDSIVAACLRLIRDPARREALEASIRRATLRTWGDVTRDLLRAIEQPTVDGENRRHDTETDGVRWSAEA